MKTLMTVIVAAFLLTGCAANTQVAKPLTDLMDMENQFVRDVLEHSDPVVMATEMAFFRELLGPRDINFKCCIKEGFDDIEAILLNDDGSINTDVTDLEIMRVHGIRWLMLSEGLQEAIKQFAPNVLKYLPAFFLFP